MESFFLLFLYLLLSLIFYYLDDDPSIYFIGIISNEQLVVEFADVRILALGVLCKPRSIFTINENARVLLHPPGVVKEAVNVDSDEARVSPTTTLGSHLDRLNARIKCKRCIYTRCI